MKLMDTTPTLYAPDDAEKAAAGLRASDPDWEYRVVHDPKGTGYSFIEVHDEDGVLIGHA